MELKRYGHFLRRHAVLVLSVALLVALVAAGLVSRQDRFQQATGAVLLKITDPRPVTDYDYDQFYALQATEVYSTNVLAWLNSGDVNDSIRRNAGATEGTLRGRKTGGTIELTGNAPTKPQAEALVKSGAQLIEERTAQLRQSTRSSFTTIPTAITTREVEPNPLRAGAIGFLAGLIFGLSVALVREGLRPAPRRR